MCRTPSALALVGLGCIASAVLADGRIALASGAAFVLAELLGYLFRMDVPDKLRARANRPLPPAIEQVRLFLSCNLADADGLADLRADLARTAKVNRRTVLRDAEAIEAMLADPPPPGTLAAMVAADGNWVLDEYSDAAAAAFLRELAVLIREVVDS